MRYMLVNTGTGSVKIDLLSPDPGYNYTNLNRQGPLVSLSIKRGLSINILPRFNGSVEKAYESIKISPDAIKLIGPNGPVVAYVCDDDGTQIDIEKLLSKKVKKTSEVTKPIEQVKEPVKPVESIKVEEPAPVESVKVEEVTPTVDEPTEVAPPAEESTETVPTVEEKMSKTISRSKKKR